MISKKNNIGLIIASIGLGMIAVFRARLANIDEISQINDKLFDLKLITVNDYCIGCHIPENLFTRFKENRCDMS